MRTVLRVVLPLTLVLSAGVAAAGKPKTPLGKWMLPNVGDAKSSGDYDTLQKSLQLVADKPPPGNGYPRWVELAKAGVAAAAKQDSKALSKSCTDCHDLYRPKYIADFPNRPFP